MENSEELAIFPGLSSLLHGPSLVGEVLSSFTGIFCAAADSIRSRVGDSLRLIITNKQRTLSNALE